LRWTQWLGVVIIIGVVSLLPVQRRREIVAVPAASASASPSPA
jgi:lauroyl/myristoyl acyltransferase